jgi:glycosyltransferase involved in cell wall biosynthesis
MRFSLITATLSRTNELHRLLRSLERQTYRDFELVIVDQNPDERLIPILSEFENRFEIRRVTSAPGLSRARNVGLREIDGDVVCFPDDDCWYPEDLLERLKQLFKAQTEWQGVVGDPVDESGKPTLPWSDKEGRLTLPMSWRRAISHAIFLRSGVIKAIGGFNEMLGLGADSPWGSGEDNDIVLRALKAGFYVHYDPKIQVYHPRIFPTLDSSGYTKRYKYALGDGKLLQNHPMPMWWQALFFAVPTCKAIGALARFNRRETYFHWLTVVGRAKGFFSAKETGQSRIPFPLEAFPSSPRTTGIGLHGRSASAGR